MIKMEVFWYSKQILCSSLTLLRRQTLHLSLAANPAYVHHTTIPALRCRFIHLSPLTARKTAGILDPRDKDHVRKEKEMIVHQGAIFDEAAKKARDKKTFKAAVATYLKKQGVYRRGHVEFIYAALDRMKEFNVARDIDGYRYLLELFPKKKMIAQNMWQSEMMYYPKQQQCCIDVLNHMEYNGVIPDDEMGYQLMEIFGKKAHAFRKYQRMMYWLPKFKYANPYYVPYELPEDGMELAKMALKRMSVDLQNKVNVFEDIQISEISSSSSTTYVASAQSPEQQELLSNHPKDKPVFVEGGYTTWLRSKSLVYFVLRSDTTDTLTSFKEDKTQEDETNWFKFGQLTEGKRWEVVRTPSVHEQADGTVLAMCITGTACRNSLAAWIRLLQTNNNPELADIPVVFSLRTPETGLQVVRTKEYFSQLTLEDQVALED